MATQQNKQTTNKCAVRPERAPVLDLPLSLASCIGNPEAMMTYDSLIPNIGGVMVVPYSSPHSVNTSLHSIPMVVSESRGQGLFTLRSSVTMDLILPLLLA